MTQYEVRTVSVAVLPHGEPLYSEMATIVSITDEAAGEFVEVSQSRCDGENKIQITPEEWPSLRAAIDSAISECRSTS